MSSTERYPESTELSECAQLQESHISTSSTPLLPPGPSASTRNDKGFTALSLIILPLALHFLGSLAVASTLLYYLDGRQFYLERPPKVRLADGTLQSQQLGRYSLLQPEFTTILSVWLMVLRWVAAMWAVPLCWRVLFVLAGRHGVRYQDISWATNYGVLYPSSHFQRPLNLLLGLVLVFTLAPQPSAPLLTGSISWLPSNKAIDLPDRTNLTIAGYPLAHNSSLSWYSTFSIPDPAVEMLAVKNFNMAWTQAVEPSIFKRVIPSISHLGVGSTVDSVLLPYLSVTRIEWLPMVKYVDAGYPPFRGMLRNDKDDISMSSLVQTPRTAVLLPDVGNIDVGHDRQRSIVINVGRVIPPQGAGDDYCNSETTFLPANSTIPSFYADLGPLIGRKGITGCFAFANVSINVGHGLCSNCRVSSYSTVQNDTELQIMPFYIVIHFAFAAMHRLFPLMAPLRGGLPDPALNLEAYITALLTRLYSASWTSWADASPKEFRATTGYKPSVPVLRAEINHSRVYAWICLQLLLTFAGAAFIGLQSRSQCPLVGDADMLAFDIDTTEVTKPSPSNKGKPQERLRIEPKGDGWKVVAVDDIPKM